MINNRAKQTLEIITPYIKNKEVLDIGCLNHNMNMFELNPLHLEIKKLSSYCLGVDIEKEVLKLGNDVICADATKLELNRKFDIVFAGEFIEHIYNHEAFLNVVKKHLKKDGYLILTTPNTFYYKIFLDIIKKGKPTISKYNYCLFYPESAELLLKNNGFEVIEFHWLNLASKKSIGYIPIRFRKYFSSNFLIISKIK